MLSFAGRSVFARRRRAAMTAIAVIVGVAMIAGTFVFTDTIHAAFNRLFSDASQGADVVVSSRQDMTSTLAAPASVPAALVGEIRVLPGVGAVAGQINDIATIVGRDGKPIKSGASPTLAFSTLPAPFSGLRFAAGRAPADDGEVAIDQATASAQHYHVGDRVPIVTGEPVRQFTISGIARFGGASLRGTPFAAFDLRAAETLYAKQGRVDLVYVAAAKGVSAGTLEQEIRPLLPAELVARTRQQQVASELNQISGRLGVLTGGLLAFGLIAICIGAFVIFNTLSITVAQRTREFALLRAIGATRAQVLGLVLSEAVVIGSIASLIGLGAGVLGADAIQAVLRTSGADLPSTTLTLESRTVLIALVVGILITLAASTVPAVRVMRVAPVEALRESQAPRTRTRMRRWLAATPAVLLAIGGVLLALTSSGDTASRLRTSAIGAVLLIVAVVVLSPMTVRPAIRMISWPTRWRAGMVPRLARENAGRSPTRTAVSASSLTVGLALVLFVTVYASGLRASTNRIIHRAFLGDFTVESQDGSSGVPAASARAVAAVPGVLTVSSLKSAPARLAGAGTITAQGIDPTTIGQVYRFDWSSGSPATLAGLGLGDAIVERDTATTAHLHVGSRVLVTTETGLRTTVTVRGIYVDRALLRGFALPQAEFDSLFHQTRLDAVFVKLDPLANRIAAANTLRRALGPFPGVVARSERQLADEVSGRVNTILLLFYALLAMSVLISLAGIANTLTLSIHERTRELGLLRAVGMTPLQARRLIRGESMITATIGTIVGVALGMMLAWIVTRALSTEGLVFSPPWGQVALVVAIGLIAGVLAAIPPARRAARLDVLSAIAQE